MKTEVVTCDCCGKEDDRIVCRDDLKNRDICNECAGHIRSQVKELWQERAKELEKEFGEINANAWHIFRLIKWTFDLDHHKKQHFYPQNFWGSNTYAIYKEYMERIGENIPKKPVDSAIEG